MKATDFDSKIIEAINLASEFPHIKRVGIFGSYARGEQTNTSDIDILFDYESTEDDSFLDDIDNYFEVLQNNIGKIDFIPYKGLTNSNEKVKNSIINDVVWIYENQGKIS